MTFRRGLFAVTLCAAAATTAAAAAAAAPTTQRGVEEAIGQLGSADPRVRDQASASLQNAGRSAEPALRAALANAIANDPEVARRVRTLLGTIGRTPPEQVPEPEPSELRSFLAADHGSKLPLVEQMGRTRGAGYRALQFSRLWAGEDDDEVRATLFSAMLREPAAAASALVVRGERPAARRLLEIALAQGNVSGAAEPYVALCLLENDLPAAINRWSAPRQAAKASGDAAAASEPLSDAEANADSIAATVLSQLRRAAGDAPGAIVAARRAGDPSLSESALFDAGQGSALAGALQARPQQVTEPRQLSVIAVALHLAGDARGFDDTLARMRKLATPQTIDDVAHVLLVCGRVDDGLRTLTDAGHDDELFRLLAARGQFDEAWKLVESRNAARGERAMRLRYVAAEQRFALGDRAGADRLLARLIDESRTADVPEVHAGVAELCRSMGRGDEEWTHFRDAFRAAGGGNGDGGGGNRGRELGIASAAFHLDGADDADGGDPFDEMRGDELWQLLALRMPGRPVDERFDRARAIVEGKVPLDELVKLADLTRHGGGAGVAGGQRWFGDVVASMHLALHAAQRMKAAQGDEDRAAQYLADTVERMGSAQELATELYVRPGDWAAERGDFLKAAEWYGRAWNLDRTQSAPLYLRAWAIGRAGWTRHAAELNELALTIPLGDMYRRHAAMRLLRRRGLRAELAREAEVVRRTTRPDLVPAGLAMQSAEEDARRDGDPLAAAALQERLLLNRLGLYELAPVGYLRLPHNLHGARARGLLARGDVAAAEREIALCRALLPGDVTLPINVVPEFERLGNKPRADELYGESKQSVEAALAKYPDSANDHNNLAWLAANCGRDAELALLHATRAVELKPKNAAYLDTLAEVQFRRGDFDGAIRTMKRCLALQPNDARHREQIDRFEAGKRGEQRPMPPG
jgi:tetratricopeptide (TPR) repeat protein